MPVVAAPGQPGDVGLGVGHRQVDARVRQGLRGVGLAGLEVPGHGPEVLDEVGEVGRSRMALVVEVLRRGAWPQDARVQRRLPSRRLSVRRPACRVRSRRTTVIGERVGLMTENATISTSPMMSEAGAAVAAGRTGERRGRPGRPDPVRRLRPADPASSTSSAPAARSSGPAETKALDPDDPWGSNAVLDESDWAGQLAGPGGGGGRGLEPAGGLDRLGRGRADAGPGDR